MNKKLLFGIFAIICSLAGCKQDELPFDSKEYPFGQYKDPSVRPGDDFYMYCNGEFWNNTELGSKMIKGFFYDEAVKLRTERYGLKMPYGDLSKKYLSLTDEYNTEDPAKTARVEAELHKMLAVVDQITDHENLIDALVELCNMGANIPIIIKPFLTDTDDFFIYASFIDEDSFFDPNGAMLFLQKLGYSEEEASENAEKAMEFVQGLDGCVNQQEQCNTDLEPDLEPNSDSFVAKLFAKLGVGVDMLRIFPYDVDTYDVLNQADIEAVKAYLRLNIACDYVFVSGQQSKEYIDACLEDGEDDGNEENSRYEILKRISKSYSSLRNYILAYDFVNKVVTEDVRAEVFERCEEMRNAFARRIDKLTWMSATTKQKAQEKLAAMTFEIAHSDEWLAEALPKLDKETFAENIFEMRTCFRKALFMLTNCSYNTNLLNICFFINEFTFDEMNAFYCRKSNSVHVLPVMILYPFYDPMRSAATNYATLFSIIGHEITHGFDYGGAKYDASGEEKNWWIPSDYMEFEDRCALLERTHSCFEILPDEMPGVFANGKQTKDEDIADLGGLLIAYDAYLAHLDKEGFIGKTLDEQKRKFFESYAELWRAKYNVKFYDKVREIDTHSFEKERINGTVMNIDDWYDLYNVKWGDALYLPEERRAKIW